jgi:hypothetical protein
MHAQTLFDPSTPLATATVQDIHLELIRRSEHNAFQGTRVLADLLAHHQDWQAMLFDTYGLATDRGLPARLLKLRDMASNDYNADTLYILAVDEAAAHRLAALTEAWGAEPHIYSQEDTERALGTSCAIERLVQMWWD